MLANAEESIHVPTARAQSKCHQQCKNQMKTNPYLMFQVPMLWKVSKNRHYCQLWVYAAYIASSVRAALHAEKHRCALRYLRPAARPGSAVLASLIGSLHRARTRQLPAGTGQPDPTPCTNFSNLPSALAKHQLVGNWKVLLFLAHSVCTSSHLAFQSMRSCSKIRCVSSAETFSTFLVLRFTLALVCNGI